jgi:hypothetical protein
MDVICTKCSKKYAFGCNTCPWCGNPAPIPIDYNKTNRLPDTPANRLKNLKEYKIIGQEDEWLNGGRFDKISMENMLNSYARHGWTVKEMTSSKTFGIFFGTPRDEMMIVLERDMFYEE